MVAADYWPVKKVEGKRGRREKGQRRKGEN
jgi:hypothetical protein